MKLKVTTDNLKIGDQFKVFDEVTRSHNTYEVISDIKPLNGAFSHFVGCECKEVKAKQHTKDCSCGECDYKLDHMMWIDGETITIER